MSAIAGIADSNSMPLVHKMLARIAHRGRTGQCVLSLESGPTLGVAWTEAQPKAPAALTGDHTALDSAGEGHFARGRFEEGSLWLERDQLGVAPLYYGYTDKGRLCFASEVKALLEATGDIHELPPGCRFNGTDTVPYYRLTRQQPIGAPPDDIARELRRPLQTSVQRRVRQDDCGAWLSGGLDSSTLAALARPLVKRLHTVAAGVEGAPDLYHARTVAQFIGSQHHEVIVGLEDMLRVLPEVIYHLESFDPLLVRSSITNYLAARRVADYALVVLSGEGGDELFAGYEYLKALPQEDLPDELVDITGRLHNTALQRVDRCASAHGTVAQTAFLDPDVVDYALRIPVALKMHRNGRLTEKWILRRAMDGALPESVLNRSKAKFWEGAGVGEQLAAYADEHIPDAEFLREHILPNGWKLASKEELLYYRIFREHFGDLANLDWMGRTKNV
jgi:asparagine synthase (glutamine-hydrolysing)